MTETATARRQTSRKQAGPTTAKKRAPLSVGPQDKPIGRFAELLTEIDQPEPYQVTESVTIMPPTKARMRLIVSSQTAYVIARGQLEAMMSPITDAQGNVIVDDTGQPIMPRADQKSMETLEKLVTKAGEDYDRALFGDAYDDVMLLSEGWTGQVWNMFYKDVQDRFLPVPEDGLCPTCGNPVDEEQAGKPPASETSSNGIGTSSKETSHST
ncbi:MAG TPA: hypothetical protein VJ777_18495 [Mycobacterium sp.]|nr:hypothetical protein [Mycobacterium sp.]